MIVFFAALLIAITIHEFAHAFMAVRLGDPTPKLLGRLTLNPIAHLDPLGTLLPVILIFTGSPIIFGWGKPVQFDPYNLENPKRDAALISFAGPASNLILASILSITLRLTSNPFSPLYFLSSILPPFIILNVILAVFNLLPIHPLDGGKILIGLLPNKEALEVERFLNQYGILILLFLIFPILNGRSPIFVILSPIINLLLSVYLPNGFLV
jgi:Zn-dependent protease